MLRQTFRLLGPTLFACALLATPACTEDVSSTDTANESNLSMGNKPWDAAADREWSSFIGAIGEARAAGRCTTLNQCINDKTVNTYKADGDPDLNLFADCSKLPMELRAYFAMKTGRPFRYVSEVVGDAPASFNPDAGAAPDYRYTKGNHPIAWNTAKTASTLGSLMTRITSLYHSGFYRMAPDVEDIDTYPIDIRPGTVRPGTIYYDPNGHVLLVYRVEADGTVRFIDSHPDNSLTNTLFDSRLGMGSAATGGGFKNLRPITSGGAGYTPNAQLADYGTTQYGHGSGYYEWVRSQLSGGQAVKPDVKFGQMVDQLCVDAKSRVAAVDAGVHLSSGAIGDMPPNIYGADGDWEAFSTPGRDVKLRASFRNIAQYVTTSVAAVKSKDPSVAWDGTSQTLVARYKSVWSQSLASCGFDYTGSGGASVSLTLADVEKRIYDLSFDPYACVEMRWGAYPGTPSEQAACNAKDADHMQRFANERTMRNVIDRPAAGTDTPIGFGPATPQDIDVSALLSRMQ